MWVVPKVFSQGSAAWVIMGQSSKSSMQHICPLASQSKWLSDPFISLLGHLKSPSHRAVNRENTQQEQEQTTREEQLVESKNGKAKIAHLGKLQMTGRCDEMAFQQGIIFCLGWGSEGTTCWLRKYSRWLETIIGCETKLLIKRNNVASVTQYFLFLGCNSLFLQVASLLKGSTTRWKKLFE